MKKIAAFILAVFFILLVGCKKNNTTASSSSSGTTLQNTSISSGFPSTGTGSINGVLVAEHVFIPSFGLSQYQSSATFSKVSKPFSWLYIVFGIMIGYDNAGGLKLDTTTLKYNYTSGSGNQNTYSDTTTASNYNTVNWNIGGNGNFTAFSTPVTRGYPTIANTTYLPTTFSKSQPLTINFGAGNYGNTDSIFVMVTDNANPSTQLIYKYVAGSASSVTFTSAQLSNFSTTSSNAEIMVFAKNFSNLTNGGKNYIFIMQNDLFQFVTITP